MKTPEEPRPEEVRHVSDHDTAQFKEWGGTAHTPWPWGDEHHEHQRKEGKRQFKDNAVALAALAVGIAGLVIAILAFVQG
ncbi:hypothetical protein [Streptomyces sp. NPDC017993]|uniref:hypothetical protein n=1 Tax=Streptomyces sp. NPDC017993 TaxID=3365027 RepID=UPI0037B42EE8